MLELESSDRFASKRDWMDRLLRDWLDSQGIVVHTLSSDKC